ncbi:hypothetical protein FM120_29170 [Sphingobacterium faecium PCAi_F2.5]|nr:hypothetical protein FM120_29170 [Sphingobacterium faecium PCAi_F2.5]
MENMKKSDPTIFFKFIMLFFFSIKIDKGHALIFKNSFL